MSFSGDIKRFKEKAEKAALMVFRGTSLDMFSRIIRRTPVKTGRLRGNWQASLNTPAPNEIEGNGQQALSKAKSVTNRADMYDSIYLVNNLPYAESIEGGTSKQAPSGMVKVTIAEFPGIVAKEARKQ